MPTSYANIGRGNYQVRLHGRAKTVSRTQLEAIDRDIDRLRSGKGCVIFFPRKKGGKGIRAVQRCEGKSTFKTPSFRQAARTRAKKQCRKANLFTRCKTGRVIGRKKSKKR